MQLAVFVVLFFLNTHFGRGQQKINRSGQLLFQLIFHPFYNNYEKSCCKLNHQQCQMVVNNRGYVDTSYKGRVSTLEFNGGFEIRIWNLYPLDTGIYRCMVHGTSAYIYQDFSVEVSGTQQSPSESTTTHRTSSDTSMTIIQHQASTSSRSLKSMWITLTIVMTVLMLLVILITSMAYHRANNERGTEACDNRPHILQESTIEDLNTIVYTTVDFKPPEDHSVIYVNSQIPPPSKDNYESDNYYISREMVQYSNLVVQM
ncbi:uncharacterized protein [Paramormyrops kingsleyae]|uniref:uncharacterized protein n=1 Tax=Paramormyrops kingsleyae TaxID=1676925 RepID=UPI000CD5D20F|nr:uncharacterized protein LOC111835524 [Paramormyrops kingsleyae]